MSLDNIFYHSLVKGNSKKIEKCAKRGDNVNYKNNFGITALINAAVADDLDSVKVLVEYGAKIDDNYNYYGMSPVSYASAYGHLDIVKYFVEINANLKLVDNDGFTCLDHAIENENQKVADFLNDKF